MTRKILLFFSFILFTAVFAQKTHIVAKGDNPYNISKRYGMTVEGFSKLNPQIKEGKLSIGDEVRIDGKKMEVKKKPDAETPQAINARKLGKIVLQPKQTIYGITKQYHITESDLRMLNPNLDSQMKIGNEISLPEDLIRKYADKATETATIKAIEEPVESAVSDSVPAVASNEDTYTVQPKDNYYRITKKFGLTQSQLFELNPGLQEKGLQPGDLINLKQAGNVKNNTQPTKPKLYSQTTNPGDDGTYTVQEGDTVFGILNAFGITLDELLSQNPHIYEGLKKDMVLKIVKKEVVYSKKSGNALNVVLMLPFGFDVKDTKYRTMSSDFLAGAKLAIERNVGKGQLLDVQVIDAGNEKTFKNSLSQLDKDNTDLIVGPLFKSNVIEVLDYVGSKKIPVVAPFANSEELFGYSNLVIVQTHDKTFAEKIAKEIAQVYSDQKIYIVADEGKTNANIIKNNLEQTLKNPNIIMLTSPKEMKTDKNMMTGQSAPIIAVLANDNEDLGGEFATRVIDLTNETQGMKAFSMYYNPAFDKKQEGLSQANLVYLMDRKINTDGDFEKEILSDYKKKFCKSPTKYAVIGFDVMNDILSRENKNGELFKQITKSQTQLATKFEYLRTKNNGAYINTGYRVVRLVR